MTTWNFGGLAPVFQGPDFSPLSIKQTDTGQIDLSGLFTLDEGPMTFSNNGASPVGVDQSVLVATGVYKWAGAVTPGTYAMKTRALGVDSPPSYVEYAWTLIVNAVTNAPQFNGPINNQITSINATFDTSVFATGQTSYSVTGALPPGITFDTGTGIYTINVATAGYGAFGPFVTNYINATGSTPSNPFTITVFNSNPLTNTQLQTVGRGIGVGVLNGV